MTTFQPARPLGALPLALLVLLAGLVSACGGDGGAHPAGSGAGHAAKPAASPSGPQPLQNLLSNIGFVEGTHQFTWHSNNEANQFSLPDDVDPERARLVEKAQIYRQVSVLDGREGVPYRLTVKARKVDTNPLRLRMQVSWLPQGGWKAKDAAGKDLVRSDIQVVDVDSYGWETYHFDLTQAPEAIDAVVYIVNAGPNAVDVCDITFERMSTSGS